MSTLTPRAVVLRIPRHSTRWSLELLWALAAYRIRIRYKETLLGFGWIFLQPVALTIVFGYISRIASIPSGGIPYPLFAATGLIVWSFTTLAVSQSLVCVSGYAAVIRRVAVPKILFPFSVVLSALVDFGVMALFVIAMALHYRTPIAWPLLLWVPVLLALHVGLLAALTCLVSLTNVYLRDVGQALPSLLQIWFFASPVFYPSSLVPEEFKGLAQWNPLTGLIEGYRSVLLLGEPPETALLLKSAAVTVLLLAAAVPFFLRAERSIADAL